jgi:GNAT superfamily N-acetyltransferase
MAVEGQNTLGTIAVVENTHYNQYTHQQTAFFGFFDCLNHPRVSQNLFDAAFDWSRQRGLTRIIGPRGLLNSEPGGVLIEGFEYPAVMGVPYNFNYYDALISSAGFHKVTDHLSGRLEASSFIFPEKVQRAAELVRERHGFTMQSFKTIDEIKPWIPAIIDAHAATFVNNHEYYPPTSQEYDEIVSGLLAVADPKLVQIATKEDQVIGFIFAYPDLSQGFCRAKGRVYPFGWAHLLHAKKHSKVVMVNGLGIRPEYRGRGSNALMYSALSNATQNTHYERLEAVMVNEINFTSKSDNETMGVRWYKRHRSYERVL